MIQDGLNMVDQATEAMRDFNLGDFIEYDGNQIFTSGLDGIIKSVADAKSAYDLLDNLMETDLLSGLMATLDYLGLGEFKALLSAGSDLLANISNTIVELMTTFGASLFERLEVLGILENKCKNKNVGNLKPSDFAINIMLGGLFNLLKCYGFDTQVAQIVDMVDPLVEKNVVDAQYNLTPAAGESSFIPATTVTERTGAFNGVFAKQLNTMLNENAIDNVIDMGNYDFSKDIAKHHEDPTHAILMGLNNDTTKRDDPAGDYDKIMATFTHAGLAVNVSDEYTKFSELAKAKADENTVITTPNTTVTDPVTVADMQSLFSS